MAALQICFHSYPLALILTCTPRLNSGSLFFQSLTPTNQSINPLCVSFFLSFNYPKTAFSQSHAYQIRVLYRSSTNICYHDTTHGCRHCHTDLLHSCHSLRPVHWSSLLEVWFPYGMLHDHGLHAQYVHSHVSKPPYAILTAYYSSTRRWRLAHICRKGLEYEQRSDDQGHLRPDQSRYCPFARSLRRDFGSHVHCPFPHYTPGFVTNSSTSDQEKTFPRLPSCDFSITSVLVSLWSLRACSL